jgi:hypothetical protein
MERQHQIHRLKVMSMYSILLRHHPNMTLLKGPK